MTVDEWQKVCYEVAKEHPEWVRQTFDAFSEGVRQQAMDNREKVSNMGAALSMVYMKPHSKQWRKLARERLIESRQFEGTLFGKQLEKDQSMTKQKKLGPITEAFCKAQEIRMAKRSKSDQKRRQIMGEQAHTPTSDLKTILGALALNQPISPDEVKALRRACNSHEELLEACKQARLIPRVNEYRTKVIIEQIEEAITNATKEE